MVKERNLTDAERTAAYHDLLAKSNGGKLRYGSIAQVATKYNVHRKTILHIRKLGQASWSALEQYIRSKVASKVAVEASDVMLIR